MAYPTEYERAYGFQSYQNANPTRPLPGDKVDVEYDAVAQSIGEIRDFLALFTRADGALANGSVGVDQMDASLTIGFSVPRPWEASTDYAASSTVFFERVFYQANVAHTSGVSFDASKWDLVADFNIQADNATTFAKMQDIATNSLIGRDTAGTGDPETILLDATLEMDGSGNLRRAALTGDVTAAAGSNATTIATNSVTFAKMATVATDVLLGRDTASIGNVEVIAVGGGIEFTGSAGIQTSAFTGDVTKAAGATALTIANDAVTYAKMQNVSATDRLLGRDTAGAGDPEELTVGGGIEFTGAGGIRTTAFTGDVTKTAGGTALTIANDAVTYAKMQNVSATDRLLGRDTAAAGDVEELTVGGGIEFTGSTGIQTSAFTGDVTKTAGGTALTIASNAVTYAKLQDMVTSQRALGRNTAGSGDAEEVSASQILDWLGATQGQVLFRGGTNWTALAAGTSGQRLETRAGSANPAWSGGSGTFTGAGPGTVTLNLQGVDYVILNGASTPIVDALQNVMVGRVYTFYAAQTFQITRNCSYLISGATTTITAGQAVSFVGENSAAVRQLTAATTAT